MTNKLIQAMIGIVIGLALLPVVAGFASDLTTGTTPVLTGSLATLVDLVPVLYVILLIVGAVGYMSYGKK